jgi:TATA-binding protein-associated factor Taf7
MEKNSVYTIAITVFVFVILISLYNFYTKIKKLHSTQVQIQKHLMYQQGVIEKHSSLLQTGGVPVNSNVLDESPPPLNTEDDTTTEDKREPIRQQSRPQNPIESLLPMLSSVMGMMSQGQQPNQYNNEEEEEEEEGEEDDEYEDDDDEEEEEKDNEEIERKMEMVQEIEKELKELNVDNLEEEGRVDDETPTKE